MPTRKRSNYHPVCYIVTGGTHRVCVNNQFVAKIIFQLWCQQAVQNKRSRTVTVYALMSPNSWSTWSRKHIIQLINGMWKERLVNKCVIVDGVPTDSTANSEFKLFGDDYERHAEFVYRSMAQHIQSSLHHCLMYPQILQIILRAPTALAAEIALKVAGITRFDATKRISNIKEVWNYLHYEVKR